MTIAQLCSCLWIVGFIFTYNLCKSLWDKEKFIYKIGMMGWLFFGWIGFLGARLSIALDDIEDIKIFLNGDENDQLEANRNNAQR